MNLKGKICLYLRPVEYVLFLEIETLVKEL